MARHHAAVMGTTLYLHSTRLPLSGGYYYGMDSTPGSAGVDIAEAQITIEPWPEANFEPLPLGTDSAIQFISPQVPAGGITLSQINALLTCREDAFLDAELHITLYDSIIGTILHKIGEFSASAGMGTTDSPQSVICSFAPYVLAENHYLVMQCSIIPGHGQQFRHLGNSFLSGDGAIGSGYESSITLDVIVPGW